MMEYSYKFRIYPTSEQESLIQRTFGCCRYVFNHYLADRQEEYRTTGKSPTRFQQDKDLTILKKHIEWLKEVDAIALQSELQNLDLAFQNFFRRVRDGIKPYGYPQFKRKRADRKSYKTKQNIALSENHIKLPKLGWVRCKVSKQVEGRILSATVSQNAAGKYFVAINCTDVELEPLPETGAVVGVD